MDDYKLTKLTKLTKPKKKDQMTWKFLTSKRSKKAV